MLAPNYVPEAHHTLIAELAGTLESSSLHWLSGYFAGIAQARQPAREAVAAPPLSVAAAPATDAAQRLTILYGSQTGNAKRLATQLYEQVQAQGLEARLVRADQYKTKELKDEQLLYVVMSTQGDGDAPDDSIAWVEFVLGKRAPKLPRLKYAVLGLGDSSYPSFCGISQKVDARLAELGAQRLQDAGTADLDIDTVAGPWQTKALEQAREALKPGGAAAPQATVTPLHPQAEKFTRDRPFQAEVLLNQPITGRDSDRDVRHIELSLEGSNLQYEPGDALGVWPVQDDTLVARILETTGLNAADTVDHQGTQRPLGEWLGRYRELTVLTRPFLTALAERAQQASLNELLKPEAREQLAAYLGSHQLIDALRQWPSRWSGPELVAALRPLTPRLYSIASSTAVSEDEVHLTLGHVAFEQDGESRWGVASHFLSERAEGETVPVFIEENSRFRLPADPARDIIMIGAGTGVAPFRAFVQARAEAGADGRNWLFFGNPHFTSDFLYQTEWQQALKDGSLNRIDLAFSRDQGDKVYVQHKLLEQGADVYDWIQAGAHVYVCGDANRMARDVNAALLEIARDQGGLDEEGARQWLDDLSAQGRYARDVY
ncbi:assimilatory sulfite reductase (NADPH) flavoprotein subunit [Castellaniella caeni]|uniref:assimilatory sulfite reductase (NADPH) flavoprotein subunit n=1 Tax=Castellaniella caeni TaxID=266123 RepID=UPI00082BCC66|nr:assimilatory sulfite reductase (NADPH) flavoprotein subunit [Castellaniella caeni]